LLGSRAIQSQPSRSTRPERPRSPLPCGPSVSCSAQHPCRALSKDKRRGTRVVSTGGRKSGFARSHSVPPNTCVVGQTRLAEAQPIGGRGKRPSRLHYKESHRWLTSSISMPMSPTASLSAFEAGTPTWYKPWTVEGGGAPFPLRSNGEACSGMNVLMLWLAADAKGYRAPRWFTYC
jgi:hypothetical protein